MTAYDKALYLLSIREYSEGELRSKLSLKGFSKEDIESAVSSLKGEGALSDGRFARSFIRSRLRKSPEGKNMLMMRLESKGVDRSISKNALEEAWTEGEYIVPLKKEMEKLEKKYGRENMLLRIKKKGFTPSDIKAASENDDE